MNVTTKPSADGTTTFWNDAKVIGDLSTPQAQAALALQIAAMVGRQFAKGHKLFRTSTADGCWPVATRTLEQWIESTFSRHVVSDEKMGECFVPAEAPQFLDKQTGKTGAPRKKEAIRHIYLMMIDVDNGGEIDDVIDALLDLGLFALVTTSHSHNNTEILVKRDEVIRKVGVQGAVGDEHVQTFYREHSKDRFTEDFIGTIKVIDEAFETPDGVRVKCSTAPQQKFRVAVPLEAPVDMRKLANSNIEACGIWADKLTGFATVMLKTHFDTACTDPSRLYFKPKHKAGAEFRAFVIAGRALRWDEIPSVSKADYARNRMVDTLAATGDNPFAEAARGAKIFTPVVRTEDGFDVTTFVQVYGHRLRLADLIRDRAGDKLRSDQFDKVECECPFEGDHSTAGGNACAVWNPDDSPVEGKALVKCQHSCKDTRSNADYIAKMIDDGWFEVEDLTDDQYLDQPSDQDLEDEEAMARHEDEVEGVRSKRRARAEKATVAALLAPADPDNILDGEDPSGETAPENIEPPLLPPRFFKNGEFKAAMAEEAELLIAKEMKRRVTLVDIEGEPKFIRHAKIGKPMRIVSKTALDYRFAPQVIEYWTKSGKRVLDPVKIFISAIKPHYEGLCFEPDPAKAAECSELYNTWTGLPVAGKPGKWDLLQAHLKDNIVDDNGGSEEANDYLCQWLILWAAHIFQFPGSKMPTSLVLVGGQRVGKSVFVDFLRAALKHLAYKVSRGEQLTGKFNSHLAGRLLIVSEEAVWAGDAAARGTLKDLISSTTMDVEMKGVNSFEQSNFARIVFISNEDWVVPIDQTGEGFRFACYRVSERRKNDVDYFGKIKAQMADGGLEAMIHDLLTYDPVEHGMTWDLLWEAPATAERARQATQSLTGAAAALVRIIRDGEFHGRLTTGETFSYQLSETEPTDVPTMHLANVISSSKTKHGGDAKETRKAVNLLLGPEAYINSPRAVPYRSEVSSATEDRTVTSRVYRFPPLAQLQSKVGATWG